MPLLPRTHGSGARGYRGDGATRVMVLVCLRQSRRHFSSRFRLKSLSSIHAEGRRLGDSGTVLSRSNLYFIHGGGVEDTISHPPKLSEEEEVTMRGPVKDAVIKAELA